MRTHFDPLQYLEYELRLDLSLDSRGSIVVKGLWSLHPHQKQKAQATLTTYNKLLRLQLNAPSRKMRPSVRKLLAQGKIEIKGGQYVKRGDLLQNQM
ncbi:hypothetical protein Dthio_PD0432 [Desulfonatronospira thiodismutans ASO3-1]|uniref:Uncharacterized protein n=1 Tax=Desulfonatronospira thiodismutans ASO3-1 TaxID=555779 RepID=D6SU26_9BACT|nr:hypothetical protein [Desulfonatronospira thiodismutans]EFI33117.1 hypothetical protein Dthio_PD0432 [Desulfonatronospira thiodismutans ASO3-1]